MIEVDEDGLPPRMQPTHLRCQRCNRKIKGERWRRIGYGKTYREIVRYERVMAEAGNPTVVPLRGRLRHKTA